MQLRWFFLNFSDRLPRKWWWIVSACLYFPLIVIAIVSIMAPPSWAFPDWAINLVTIVRTLLVLSINVKRFNDLNLHFATGYIYTIGIVALRYFIEFGFAAELGGFVSALLFWVSLFVSAVNLVGYAFLGFHRGTVGRNGYGEDPLGGTPAVELAPSASGAPSNLNYKRFFLLPFGRINRLVFVLASSVVLGCAGMTLVAFFYLLNMISTSAISYFVFSMVMVQYFFGWLLCCLAVKRMHDAGRCGFWPVIVGYTNFLCFGELTHMNFDPSNGTIQGYLVAGFMMVTAAWLSHELLLRPGTPGDNAFGPGPSLAPQKKTD
jgi:uncharacterized membrane protein YhaH (DUF805 family)